MTSAAGTTGLRSVATTGGLSGLAVPMYVHPVLSRSTWRRLSRASYGTGFLVANVANGPGTVIDREYSVVVDSLLAARAPVLGYVDSGYGVRAPSTLARQAVRWRSFYGVDAVFVDRVESDGPATPKVVALVDHLKQSGMRRVVLNPGVMPSEGFGAAADAVVTFEGPWSQYRRQQPLALPPGLAPGQVCHLVYGVPRSVATRAVMRHAESAAASILGVSTAQMPNPWNGSLVDSPGWREARW